MYDKTGLADDIIHVIKTLRGLSVCLGGEGTPLHQNRKTNIENITLGLHY